EEVQDNDGTTDDGVVDSSVTLAKLRDTVLAAGGPRYDYRRSDPVDDRDGGQPGGHIRGPFFLRTPVPGLPCLDRPGRDRPTANPAANVIVLGDLNDFQFSDTVSILKGAGLQALIDTLPSAERYTYVFDGNSQAIDHILMGGGLAPRPFAYDVVHVNSEFAAQ